MEIMQQYSRALANSFASEGSAASIFKALEQFDAEDRKVIASRLNEVLEFEFASPSAQELVRKNLKALSPDSDLSWIPDWRKDREALFASTENKN
ncbi:MULTISPECIES: hypothetical protein [Pseudomonas]|uniref:Uncharacterized protein n=1 Tax=Pseudomonas putida TaxID=303 RepID=A0A7V8J1Y8_PSEPU|nr:MULTISPECIES: hypothetical protein [Pseudomonas]KAF0252004.1 hypothetical protein GN299_25525 [Pseudomonas putida]MCK2124678.1 hypothetical protein [Pseudomonas sp. PNPG3]